MLNIILLFAGHTNIDAKDADYPLCLTEINGTTLLEVIWSKWNSIPQNPHFIFTFSENDIKKFHLDNIAKLLAPTATIVSVADKTAGAVCATLLAIDSINNDEPLIIINGNHMVNVSPESLLTNLKQKNLDAQAVTFPSLHPRYSYVRTENDLVIEAAEKQTISKIASAGIFLFSHGKDYVSAAMDCIKKGAHHNGLYYVAPVLNELVLAQKRIGIYNIAQQDFVPLKNQRQLDKLYSTIPGSQ